MPPPPTTRERILDSAETLFGRHGISGTSLRAITSDSNVNLAAVNYHFGSKAALARAVVGRRLEPLNAQRLRLLSEALEGHPGEVRPIVNAFVAPAIHTATQHPDGHRFARMVSRALTDPHEDIRGVVYAAFEEVAGAFFAALRDALPHLSEQEVAWRLHFMIGAMAHAVSCCVSDDPMPVPIPETDADALTAQLASFLAAGLVAEPAL